MSAKPKTALGYILLSLMPYSRANLLLATHPHRFFNELEQLSGYKHRTLVATFQRAKKTGYLHQEENLLKLTEKGRRFVQPYVAEKLNKDVLLFIIFDIPEQQAFARRRLRLLLRQWHFSQIQKSVWASQYDFREPLVEAIKELALEDHVQLFKGAKLYP